MCITCSIYSNHKSCRLHLKACRTLSTAQKIAFGLPRTKVILDAQVADQISLVPFVHHLTVIKSAIKSNTNVVVTSYISPAVKELNPAAKKAGIVQNEVGVDPGVDHLYAVRNIDEIHAKGGKICTS